MLQMIREGLGIQDEDEDEVMTSSSCCTDEDCITKRNTRNLYILQELENYMEEAYKDFNHYEYIIFRDELRQK